MMHTDTKLLATLVKRGFLLYSLLSHVLRTKAKNTKIIPVGRDIHTSIHLVLEMRFGRSKASRRLNKMMLSTFDMYTKFICLENNGKILRKIFVIHDPIINNVFTNSIIYDF